MEGVGQARLGRGLGRQTHLACIGNTWSFLCFLKKCLPSLSCSVSLHLRKGGQEECILFFPYSLKENQLGKPDGKWQWTLGLRMGLEWGGDGDEEDGESSI